MEEPLPCPRCGSKMNKITGRGGGLKTWPSVALSCENNDCLWHMEIAYDEFSGRTDKVVLAKLIKHYNEGVGNVLHARDQQA